MFSKKTADEFWELYDGRRLWEECWGHVGSASCSCEHCAAIRAYPNVRCECAYCRRCRSERERVKNAHLTTER